MIWVQLIFGTVLYNVGTFTIDVDSNRQELESGVCVLYIFRFMPLNHVG